MKCCQDKKNPLEPCKPGMDCYVNSPEHYNCFMVYMHYNRGKNHTLQEVAKLMDMSHTTIKCIEDQALNKLRDLLKKEDDLGLGEFRGMEPLERDD